MPFLDKPSSVAKPGYSRWLIPPAALAVHMSIGQVYAFSVFKTSLVHRFGSSQTAVAWVFSLAIVCLGLSAAIGGRWVERNGPRRAMLVSAIFWFAGFLVGALGIATGQLILLYLGYGVLGGIGLGIGYISPVSTLIKWFPDRPGLATGMAIMGFGGGALVAAPLSNQLLRTYDSGFDPNAKGAVASTHALAMTFVTLGIIYLIFMMIGVALMRLPQGYGGHDDEVTHQAGMSGALVRANEAIKTRQFYLLWIVLFCNVTAGIGILEQAAPMIQDFFRDGKTSAVSAAVAAGFVGLLSVGNMLGRFTWSTTSDIIGRKPMYMVFLGVGAVLYLLLATVGHSATAVFVLLALFIISFYGGGFATVPAYLKDLYGTLEVGAIHGRLLTAWSAAGVVGPLIVNGYLDAAGKPGNLIADDYKPALFTMVGVLVVGFIANLLINPVNSKYFDPMAHAAPEQQEEAKLA
ncbi:OFA family MFS transporter [Calidifontibacter sp. DB0510]|uniref:OFA family MFS transporter n=1 Tax=Metallococcus carri TaxID=1656884 RepID=A0A967B478_9MICO|nr:OFA family MFS transporter [Metallococcus carri]NHN56980.1 OFA family MFS transporter [Metallococcus carri]NOP37725.1 OFA family MFS transporter [Calidifontibacter sp. DB2511S]